MISVDVVVVGAGPAGLAAAFRLAEEGLDVQVMEAADHAGGKAWTETDSGYLLETGPHTFRGEAGHLWSLIEALDLEADVQAVDRRAARYILRDGQLHSVPQSAMGFLATGLLSPAGKIRVLTGPLRGGGRQDRTVAQWVDRRFGEEFRRIFVESLVGGIFAGNSRELDMAQAFPRIWAATGAQGRLLPALLKGFSADKGPRPKGIFALRRGFAQLTDSLGQRLGDRLNLSQAVEAIVGDGDQGFRVLGAQGLSFKAKQVILATEIAGVRRLLPRLLPKTAALLGQLQSVPMATAYLGGPGESPLPPGFGALMPRGEGFRMLGALNVSSVTPDRAPKNHWLVTAYFGGRHDEGILEASDELILDQAQRELGELAEGSLRVGFRRLRRHPAAIPQPDLQHGSVVESLRKQVNQSEGLHLAGSYLDGVSVDAAVGSGFKAADRVMAELVP